MATRKGVIQGFAAQAAVDASHQVIVAADVSGSGSEQAMLLPMIEQTQGVRAAHTIFTADAGYHSKENIEALQEAGIPAMVADGQMRKRDESLAGQARHKIKPDPLQQLHLSGGLADVQQWRLLQDQRARRAQIQGDEGKLRLVRVAYAVPATSAAN